MIGIFTWNWSETAQLLAGMLWVVVYITGLLASQRLNRQRR